jgi:hypothetical protein
MQKVFESVDRSPLGGAAVPEPALSAEGGHSV